MVDIDLRTFSWIDCLQPQTAGFLGTVCAGDPPLPGDAAALIEVSPGMEINRALDVVLKRTKVVPGLFLVERRYGVLQFHHRDQGQVRDAGACLLEELRVDMDERQAPELILGDRITGVDAHQAQMVNRMRHGNEILPQTTLYVAETRPAGYALLVANEAEKAAHVDILEFRAVGAFGRVYLGGNDADIQVAITAIHDVISRLSGNA